MRTNILIIMIAATAATACAAATTDHIVSQVRDGPRIIVTWESGAITTNALFLRMSPDVVADIERRREDAAMVAALRAVAADTRTNIPETASMRDTEIATLYLQQMRKSTTPLLELSPVDTVEYVIGTGIRQDLSTQKKEKIE